MLPLLLLLIALAAAPPGVTPTAATGLQAAAESALAERFPSAADHLTVRVLRTGGALNETAPLRLVFPQSEAAPRGHTQVDVLASADGAWKKTGWALLYVAHFDSVVVARRAVRRGEAVAPADLGVAWIETTRFHGTPLRAADLPATAGLLAARSLRPDRALRQGDLRPPPAAETGDTVTMRYRRGSLVFDVPCHAREPGAIGDAVRLHNPTTKATYRARLTGPATAEWIATL